MSDQRGLIVSRKTSESSPRRLEVDGVDGVSDIGHSVMTGRKETPESES